MVVVVVKEGLKHTMSEKKTERGKRLGYGYKEFLDGHYIGCKGLVLIIYVKF